MWLKYLTCAVFLIAINICDIKYYKIKNILILPLILIGIAIGMINGNVLDCVYGMLIPLILFPLYALKMLGAGDVKAFCAFGTLFGFSMSIRIIAFSLVAGGMIALGFMLFNKNFVERFRYLFEYLKSCFLAKKVLQYHFGGKQNGYFRFSYAITAGTVLAIANQYICLI